jgi:tRNA 5-methylaminomethyl-2-thiouridine biosynthesis bifunctional protein
MVNRIEPAELSFDAAGAPFSARYGDVYASRTGAAAQARHVFLGGNDLPARWAGAAQFVILELGFGLGINFLATWQAWRHDPRRPRRLHFVSIEKHPLPAAALRAQAPDELSDLAQQLAAAWPLPLPGLHRIEFDGGAVQLTLALGDAQDLLPQLALGADAFYLDGFAPARNPQLWDASLLKRLAWFARPGATAATYTVARPVREALGAAGFEVTIRPGLAPKREMLSALFAPRWKLRRHEPAQVFDGERHAIVVGAGIAGCATSAALARRGWRVTLLETAARVAAGASGLPLGLMHPHVAADDSVLARLTRAGFFASGAALAAAAALDPGVWQQNGVLQQARDATEETAWRRMVEALGFPADYVAHLDANAAARCVGLAPCFGGLWFRHGGVVGGDRWCRALLRAAGGAVDLRCGVRPAALAQSHNGWRVRDATGATIADAPILIAANGLGAPQLLVLGYAPLTAVRGRMSLLAPGSLPDLRGAVAGDGYVLRGADGAAAVGSSYEVELSDAPAAANVDQIHRGNLQRLERLLAHAPQVDIAAVFDGVRAVAPDRMPLAGSVADESAALAAPADLRGAQLADLPRAEGLFALFGLASRGLALAPLLAELIAAQIEGEPWPIERDLAAAVDPARFLLRRLRRGR